MDARAEASELRRSLGASQERVVALEAELTQQRQLNADLQRQVETLRSRVEYTDRLLAEQRKVRGRGRAAGWRVHDANAVQCKRACV